MAHDDRERWNARYRAGGHSSASPSPVLLEMESWVPDQGRVLDLAGGVGANALWLAQRGLAVTLADVSEVALAVAVERALGVGVDVGVAALDLETEPVPAGPWAMVLCCNYLQRDLTRRVAEVLKVGGRWMWIHPTVENLQRHAKPGARFLLEPGEAVGLAEAAGLRILVAEETWVGDGDGVRHLARVVAERTG